MLFTVALTLATQMPTAAAPAPSVLGRSPTRSASLSSPLGLRVEGNRLMNAAGQPVILHGVNRPGTEYMCAQGRGIFDGPHDQASIDAIKSWRTNAVRVPLNEHCWLGINGVLPAYGGAAYQEAIREYVSLLSQNGLYVILDLHWSRPGTTLAGGPQPMPNAEHSPTFWSQVAGAFKDNGAVILELFNEPHPDSNRDTDAAWTCWRDGGSCPGVPFEAAGMQTLVRAVRATGATNIIALDGVQFGNTLTRWREFEPSDPQGNVLAAWHTYNFAWCVTVSCYESNVGPVAAQVPVLATEIGNDGCDAGWMSTLMTWLDSRQIGYLAWSWHTFLASDCSSINLILDYAGTPSAYGAIYKTHLAGLPTRFAELTADVEITLGPLVADDLLEAKGTFALGTASDGVDPRTEPVTIEVGSFVTAIPPGAFEQDRRGRFVFGDADVEVAFEPLDGARVAYSVEVRRAELTSTTDPVAVAVRIGNDDGAITDEAEIRRR